MKKIVIGSLALASIVVLSGCSLDGGKKEAMEKEAMMKQEMMAKDAMMQKEAMEKEAMMKQEGMDKDAMMKKDSEWSKEEMEAMEKDGSMMKHDDAMMKKEDSAMVKPDDTMMKKDTAMIKDAYTVYSASAVKDALAAKKNVVLFFHATWCPSCKSADANFKTETAPANTVVFKVDYDTNVALRKQYGVTSQHTFVSLNADETLKKKASGVSHLADLAGL